MFDLKKPLKRARDLEDPLGDACKSLPAAGEADAVTEKGSASGSSFSLKDHHARLGCGGTCFTVASCLWYLNLTLIFSTASTFTISNSFQYLKSVWYHSRGAIATQTDRELPSSSLQSVRTQRKARFFRLRFAFSCLCLRIFLSMRLFC